MFVYVLRTAPFLQIVIPFMAGIIWPFPLLYVIPVAFFLLVLHVGIGCMPVWLRFRLDAYRGVILQLLLVCLGSLLVDAKEKHKHRLINPAPDQVLAGTVIVPVQSSQYGYRTIIALETKEQLLIYFPPDSAVMAIQEGDKLLFNGQVQSISFSGNPGAFNYRAYCASRYIYQQVHLQMGHWRHMPMPRSFLLRCRNSCLRIINTYIGGREAGLAAALLIGYRYGLDKEIENDYMQTGIVHIIAISGMHLALIYACLIWCLQWIPIPAVKGLLVIVVIWGFTLLTGASASVLRAAVMLTVVTIGKFFLDRESSTYNQLALSAFLLLCYDPGLIKDIGFQLSYLAVSGILLLYKPLYDLLLFKSYWKRKLWEATALAIAAQAITFPLCLYLFGQFPLYFLPANLLAVPLSTLILYGEMLLLCVQHRWLGMCLQWLLTLMNSIVAWIGHLPGALISGLQISVYGVVALYICIAAILAGRKGMIWMLAALCLWRLAILPGHLKRQQQQLMIVYNQPRHTGIDFIQGHVVQFVGDDSISTGILRTARAFYEVDTGRLTAFEQLGHFICCGNKRLVIVDSALPAGRATKKFKTDYLLLSHNPHVAIKDLQGFFEVGCYIFDASSSRSRIQEWKSECYALTLRFLSVPDQGAYVVNF
ncbi:ComEC/Rec2 family competence protein [Chitinophaga silvisoli]|uniref:ComEC family competence protein n=1 Tax=Chitinophaga silvisoli TaxID=2291814 RepID=A0A3E1P6B1_9BACT|nr:ComEC/Rec2 family competence protein [Chitinophaga silvisoli]RFM35721.1 ComEC family competence protein [Chitinophaga silvisoli]